MVNSNNISNLETCIGWTFFEPGISSTHIDIPYKGNRPDRDD